MLQNIPQNSSLITNSVCHLSIRTPIQYSISIWISQVTGEQISPINLVRITIIPVQTGMTFTRQILPEYQIIIKKVYVNSLG